MDLKEEIVRVFLRVGKEDRVSNMETGGLFYFIFMNVSFYFSNSLSQTQGLTATQMY